MFRELEVNKLNEHIRYEHSVEMVGMKRVGLGDFLQYFLSLPPLSPGVLYVRVHMQELVERDLYSFWRLTYIRFVEAVDTWQKQHKTNLGIKLPKKAGNDVFEVYHNVLKLVEELLKKKIHPVFFFIRFDRLINLFTPDFFDSLRALRAYGPPHPTLIFTSWRSLKDVHYENELIKRASLKSFVYTDYFLPAEKTDAASLLERYSSHYQVPFTTQEKELILTLTGHHAHYIKLCVLVAKELKTRSVKELERAIFTDERIEMQSEELYESLTRQEQLFLQNSSNAKTPPPPYVLKTGIIGKNGRIFSPIFERYIREFKRTFTLEAFMERLTKKEKLLFELLLENMYTVVEREQIMRHVWSEIEDEADVSDWTLDKLVARLREKIDLYRAPYTILTYKTRGFKLTNT